MSDQVGPYTAPGANPSLRGRLSGGNIPAVGDLVSQTGAEFMANMGPYILAGVGMLCVQMPLIFVMIIVMYLGTFTLMFGGMFASIAAGALVGEAAGDEAGAVVGLLGYLGTMGLMFVGIFVFAAVIGGIMAPFSASLWREVAAHQRGDSELGFGSAFKQLTQDIVPVMIVTALMLTAVFVGMIFCYLPGFAASLALMFALPLVYLHRLGPIAALRQSVATVMHAPGQHIVLWLTNLAIGLVANYVPILGMMFMMALHVRLYREIYGDDPEPVLA